MTDDCQIYQQVPHEVVIAKTLLGIEPRTDSVEYATRTNQRQEWGRGTPPKVREEDYNHPSHNQIYRKADRWY